MVAPDNISEITSISLGDDLMFLPKLSWPRLIHSCVHMVNNWGDIEELGKGEYSKLLLIYGYFKSGANIGHYVVCNFYYLNGKGVILDGCYSKNPPQNAISFVYNREIAELILEEPKIAFIFIPTNNTLNNLSLLNHILVSSSTNSNSSSR